MKSSGLLGVLARVSIFIGRSDQQVHEQCPGTTISIPERCCRWLRIREVVQENIFDGGECGKMAQAAIRLTFHDSVGLSKALESSGQFGGGGADGSIIKYHTIELAYPSSRGLESITLALGKVADDHNASYGDIIQFAGAVALSNCPGSPRLQFLAGRLDARSASPPYLVPSPADSVGKILSRMADAGFSAEDTVALLASHSIGRQEVTDLTVSGMPLDSTPGRFDSQFYLEVLLKGTSYTGRRNKTQQAKAPFPHEFRLASDAAIARAPETACQWQSFISEQRRMSFAFRNAMMKLANNGQNVDNLVDCSEVIPVPKHWDGPAILPPTKTIKDLDHPVSWPPSDIMNRKLKVLTIL